jgi:endonuclease/exonuclease/phosphatase family metal-dependent hydrolase
LLLLGLLLLGWVLNVSTVGTHVEGCLRGCAKTVERRDGPLRVLSLNILHGFPEFKQLSSRLDLIAAGIHAQDADVVALQEVPWTLGLGSAAEYLAERTGMNHVYVRANGNRKAILFEEGEAILSRYPLKDPDFAELKPKAGFFEHRLLLRAIVVTPWGDLPVFVTHLTHGDGKINRAQAATLMSLVAAADAGPAIVAGDLNATERSPQIEIVTQKWVDTFRVAQPDDEGFTCCIEDLTRGPGEPLEKRIDYLFLVPGPRQCARVLSSQRVFDQPYRLENGWQWVSDHVGLLSAIELGPCNSTLVLSK